MKKWIILALALMLLVGTALAEDLPYIRQIEQYEYTDTPLLTNESYPEVCIYAWHASYYFDGRHEPLCLVFPGPAGASPCQFDPEMAHYLDVDNKISYYYDLDQNASFEIFLNNADSEEYILLDGSDGVAAFIDPDEYSRRCYGLISAKDFGKNAKLRITIEMGKLDKKLPQEQRVQILTDTITAEVARVRSQMHTEVRSPYWSYGKYTGVKILSDDYSKLATLDFPILEARFKDTETLQATFIPTELKYSRLKGIYGFEGNHSIEVQFNMENYSYVIDKQEKNESEVKTLVLENGSKWLFYTGNTNEDGSIYAWYATKVIDGFKDRRDKQMYFNLHFSGSYGIVWQDNEACRLILNLFDPLITLADPRDDPYVAPAIDPSTAVQTQIDVPSFEDVFVPADPIPEVTMAPIPASDAGLETWTCDQGHEGNTGKFCSECGQPKPTPEPTPEPTPAPVAEAENTEWTCVNGHGGNTGKFCSECGQPKPTPEPVAEAGNIEWACKNGHSGNTGKFCSECGEPRPADDQSTPQAYMRNEKLDLAFERDHLVLTKVDLPEIRAEDFEFTEDMLSAMEKKPTDLLEQLKKELSDTEIKLLSLSPSGNSGIYSIADTTFVGFYNNKFHMLYPSTIHGVSDENKNLIYYNSRMKNMLGEEGVVYSADGRYAGIINYRQTLIQMKMNMDPIIIDLSTGEMILTATYSNNFKEQNYGAVTTAVFSLDGRYLYYILYGNTTENKNALYRYNISSGETELCCSIPYLAYYPHLSETQDGSFIILEDVAKSDAYHSILEISLQDGMWIVERREFSLEIKFWHTKQLLYSNHSDNALISNTVVTAPAGITAFMNVKPGEDYAGLNTYYAIDRASKTVVQITKDEYLSFLQEALKSTESLPYANIVKALLSPDGHYALFVARNDVDDAHLYLVKLDTMELREIKGIDSAKIQIGEFARAGHYPPVIEWNSDTLIILTDDGIGTYQFDF